METSRDGNMSNAQVHDLLSKLRNPDMDFRYMALNDFLAILEQSRVPFEDSAATRIVEAVLKTLEDKHGEVQNIAIKCLGPLIRRCRNSQVKLVVERLCKPTSNDELRDISATALRTVIMSVPANSTVASSVTRLLMPQLLTQLRDNASASDTLLDRLDVLIELLDKFDIAVTALAAEEKEALLQVLTALLDNSRPAVRKRAVVALGALVLSLSDAQFANFMSELIQMLSTTKINDKLRTLVSLQGQISRAETQKGQSRFGDYLQTILPPVLDSLQLEDDELREIALQSLESFVVQGGVQIKRYEAQITEVALQYLRYDPNYDAEHDSDDEEMADADTDSDLGSDFEDDAEYDDDDDISWKLRRTAAKLASAMIVADAKLGCSAMPQIAPVLVSRINEREENVRVEILQTLAALLQQCKATPVQRASSSRKRSRSEGEMEIEASSSSQDVVSSLSTKIIKNITKQLASKNVLVKQYCFVVLEALLPIDAACVVAALPQILPHVRTALVSATSSGPTSSTSAFRITTIGFLDRLARVSKPAVISDHLSEIVNTIADVISLEKLNKVLLVAIGTARNLLAICISLKAEALYAKLAQKLFNKLSAADVEQDVRDELITSMSACVWNGARSTTEQACQILRNRLEQEATRTVTINSVGIAASSVNALPEGWLISITLEMLKYVNNVNRPLRLAAISTSTTAAAGCGSMLNEADVKQISQSIVSVLTTDDVQVLVSGVNWLSIFSQSIQQKDLVKSITLPIVMELLGSSLLSQSQASTTSLLAYFNTMASISTPSELLDSLYGTAANSTNLALLAQFIAAIVTEETLPTFLPSCINSIRAPKTPESRRSLELYVLGELGRFHALPSDTINLVSAQFHSPLDQVKGAASVALGNIASLDPATYSPQIFAELERRKDDRYLLAVSMKEMILKASEGKQSNALASEAENIAETLLRLSFEDRAHAVVAESIGRLTQFRPHQLLPRLRTEVKSESLSSKALVIRAIRYTFTTSSSAFDEQLRPFIVDFLSLMEDADLEIRFLALSTLYTAAHNKPGLIVDHLATLLPLLYRETVVNQELVHSVTMGPFKHIIDDGLELRKSAFETLHTLLDSFHKSMDITSVFDVILRGLDDVHEIKTLCLLMVTHLVAVAPAETRAKLDALTEKLQKPMNVKLKETAVKQEREKDNEAKRAVLRCAIALQALASDASPGFNAFIAEMKATRAKELDELQSMTSSSAANGANHDRMEM